MASAVRIVLFATAREAVGRAEVSVAVPSDGLPLRDLLQTLERQYPALVRVLPHSRIVQNGSYLRGRAGRVRPGDELAVHPPYSGG
jgi:molybdopterin converting factor small subunit